MNRLLIISFLSLQVVYGTVAANAAELQLLDGSRIEGDSITFTEKGGVVSVANQDKPQAIFWNKISPKDLAPEQQEQQIQFVLRYLAEARSVAATNPERAETIVDGLRPLADELDQAVLDRIRWSEFNNVSGNNADAAIPESESSQTQFDFEQWFGGKKYMLIIGVVVFVLVIILLGGIQLFNKVRSGETSIGKSIASILVGVCMYIAVRQGVSHFFSKGGIPEEVRNNPAAMEMVNELENAFEGLDEDEISTEAALKKIETSVRKHLPMRIDQVTKFTNITTGPGLRITYEYELDFAGLTPDQFRQLQKQLTKNYNTTMRAVKKRGVTAVFIYSSSDGYKVAGFEFNPDRPQSPRIIYN